MPIEPDPPRQVTDEERATVARVVGDDPERSDLLRLLHAIQGELGWLPEGALAELADRMNLPFPEVWGVATFYAMFRLEKPRGVVVQVCDDVPCRLRGAGELLAALEARYGPPRRFMGLAHGVRTAPARPGPVDWETVPCLGQCDRAPAAVVAGRLQREASLEAIAQEASGRA